MSFSTMVLWYSFSDFESASAAPVLCVNEPWLSLVLVMALQDLGRRNGYLLGVVGDSRLTPG